MLPIVDQVWVLMAFVGGLAGFFALAGFVAEMFLMLARRRKLPRSQAVSVTEPPWVV